MDRREFLSQSSKFAAATFFGIANMSSKAQAASSRKVRLALVGTGWRGTSTWGKELVHPFSEYVEMVGLCDINPKRLNVAKEIIGTNAPGYLVKEFNLMVKKTKPDTIIITTPDCFHAQYAIQAMELGCNVIVEKPLATDEKQCQQLLEMEAKTGKKIIVTFNARHGSYSEEIKKILLSGELGRIISAEFQEYLDVYHGADYFRRWHGKAKFSGTLLVHKASHHFDQMNWWLDAEPEEVHAFGKVDFYGNNNPFRFKNCRGCPFAEKCDFYWDINENEKFMKLYVACEDADGYLRDGCVWDNDIDTYDSMTVEVKYNNGVLLSYSLNAYMPYEGQRIAFNGEKGRLDVRRYNRQPWEVPHAAEFRLTKNFKNTRPWTVERSEGPHEGADMKLKNLWFKPDQLDPLGKRAGSRAGVMSSIIGIAARKSIESGKRIKIADMVDFPLTWKW